MADTEHPTRRDDPAATRRDDVPPGRTPGDTRRDAAASVPSLVRLPAALADRFTVLGELAAQGAESDLLHVRDAAGTECVVKIFRRGFTADRSVWEKLPTLDSPNVVRILETGHAEGRDYEVIEYLPIGNLRALGARLPAPLVAEVATQLADGLRTLHAAGIVHRDLKPENVLIRSSTPLRPAIADFGLSRVIEQSVVFASSSRTLAYAAPESLSGQVSPARDWWSLGIIVRELLGSTPFAGLSETAVVDHLATRTIDCDDIADERMRLLCRGLLTRDPRRRWGPDEVTAWMDGRSPAVAEPEPPPPPTPSEATDGLPFGGRTYTDRTELARALVADWDGATRYFFRTMFTPVGPSEAWRTLRDWLNGFADAEGRIRLVDDHLTGDHPPDLKLFRLVRWLDPTLPPHYLGPRVLPDDLPELAGAVEDRTHPQHGTACRVVRGLWDHRLLAETADDETLDGRWRGLATEWNRFAGWLRPQLPRTASRLPDAGAPGRDEPPTVLATLLALAVRPQRTGKELADAAARAKQTVREPVEWFTWLCEQGDDPLRLLAVIRAAPDAVLEVEAETRHRHEVERRTAEGQNRWQDLERQRRAGRRAALTRAVLWTLPLLALWLVGSWVAPQILDSSGVRSTVGSTGMDTDPTSMLFLVAVLAWLVGATSEVVLASRQGGDYLPLGPWSWLSKALGGAGRGLSSASRAMSGAARRTGPRGCGFLVLATLVPLVVVLVLMAMLLSIAWLIWLFVMVAAAVAHVVATGVRLHRWRQGRERAREQVVGGRA